jgi:hypothetical protein
MFVSGMGRRIECWVGSVLATQSGETSETRLASAGMSWCTGNGAEQGSVLHNCYLMLTQQGCLSTPVVKCASACLGMLPFFAVTS